MKILMRGGRNQRRLLAVQGFVLSKDVAFKKLQLFAFTPLGGGAWDWFEKPDVATKTSDVNRFIVGDGLPLVLGWNCDELNFRLREKVTINKLTGEERDMEDLIFDCLRENKERDNENKSNDDGEEEEGLETLCVVERLRLDSSEIERSIWRL